MKEQETQLSQKNGATLHIRDVLTHNKPSTVATHLAYI